MAVWRGARAAELPLPPHYNPDHAESWEYAPDQMALLEAAVEWRARHRIPMVDEATVDIHLLLIDEQKDFCLPDGALYVAGRSGTGAVDDSRRVVEFIYRNLAGITNITTTLDTHLAHQIFFPTFWVTADGGPVMPFRAVSAEEVRRGDLRPNSVIASWLADGDEAWLREYARFYCEELERAGKYQLYLWPPHCIAGSDGHPLVGVVHAARLFHSYVRGAQSWTEIKGHYPLTEHYSILRPEVLQRHDGGVLAQRNTRFLRTLLGADAVLIAGQAASHCVKSTIDDILDEIAVHGEAARELARKIYILEDCMSAVAVPDGQGGFVADFTAEAEAALERFRAAGMHVVRSTEPIECWSGIAR